MAGSKKNTTKGISKKRQPVKAVAKSFALSEDTLFPEKLARANELLSKAKLLPR